MILVYTSFVALLVLFGAAIMSLEILASNLMSPYFGGSVYVWGSIISSFMIHMSMGYVIGGYLCKRTSKVYPLTALLAAASLWVISLPMIHNATSEFVMSLIIDPRYGSFVSMNILFLFPITIMAMVSPYVIGILSMHERVSGLSAGLVLFLSTFGSFIGTNATAFYLINLFPVSTIIRGIGIITLILSLGLICLRLDGKLRALSGDRAQTRREQATGKRSSRRKHA